MYEKLYYLYKVKNIILSIDIIHYVIMNLRFSGVKKVRTIKKNT